MIGVSTSDLPPRRRRIPGSPLAVQIAALMLGGLVVAQLVTLFLTLMLPPAPEPEYRLGDIAAALKGAKAHPSGSRPLVRTIQARPPGLQERGWLVSQQSRHELAKMLGARDGDVRLLFYTPLPFAGAATQAPPRQSTAMADTPVRLAQVANLSQLAPPTFPTGAPLPNGATPRTRPADFVPLDRALPAGTPLTRMTPSAPPPDPSATIGGSPPLARDSRRAVDASRGGIPSVNMLPPGAVVFQGQLPLGPGAQPAHGMSLTTTGMTATGPMAAETTTQAASADATTTAARTDQRGLSSAQYQALASGTPSGVTSPDGGRVAQPGVAQPSVAQPGTLGAALSFPRIPTIETPRAAGAFARVEAPAATQPERARINAAPLVAPELVRPLPEALPSPVSIPAGAAVAATRHAADKQQAAPLDGPAPVPARGLFGLAPAPFVQGDFVAAMKIDAAHWAIVQPEPEPFPNSWQRRVLLWFALSFALVAPLGLLFARRLVKPLEGFADAAEQLGRDPSAPVMTLAGPAEIGRAARAFNQMQGRLRRFVDDRTAMIGAISHDLRTPLTRMRFRLEDAPDHVREGMLAEVAQMEEMITSVLHFIRDASEPVSRETMDMRSILASVVDGATLIGGDVRLEPGESAYVDIDALGMKRVLSNLVDNALKYGDGARVRLFRDGGDAVAEVIDEGPGLPEDELERVFQPFYRSFATRPAETAGMGLGLAACRSITRAHGGEVTLKRGDDGLVAEVRLPLAVA